jgi:alpha-tubulin suppressor-like RCC1 family protein
VGIALSDPRRGGFRYNGAARELGRGEDVLNRQIILGHLRVVVFASIAAFEAACSSGSPGISSGNGSGGSSNGGSGGTGSLDAGGSPDTGADINADAAAGTGGASNSDASVDASIDVSSDVAIDSASDAAIDVSDGSIDTSETSLEVQAATDGGNKHLPPSPIVQFWGGGRHSIALLADGSVWTWGSNVSGKLGNGETSASYSDTSHDSFVPLKVHGPGNVGYLSAVVAISAGEGHNLALKSDGTVWAWGWNGVAQLGNGTANDAFTPVQVSGLANVVAISGRAYHCLALKSDGTVWAWGDNRYGQLGSGSTAATMVPVQVLGLSNPASISAGYTVSLARMSDGTVRVWGTGLHGEMGQGQFGDHSYSPISVMGLSNVTSVSADFEEPNALKSDGTMWMWGWNNLGQLGNGNTADQNLPVQVSNLTNVLFAGPTGDRNNCALKNDHTVWTWGRNYNGQLGVGTADMDLHALPVQVPAFGDAAVTSVQTPDWHSLALESDGTLWGWGSNDHGQLGNGTTNDAHSPAPVMWP